MSLNTAYFAENWKLKIIQNFTVHQKFTVDMPICTVHGRRWFKKKGGGAETRFASKHRHNNRYPNGTLDAIIDTQTVPKGVFGYRLLC